MKPFVAVNIFFFLIWRTLFDCLFFTFISDVEDESSSGLACVPASYHEYMPDFQEFLEGYTGAAVPLGANPDPRLYPVLAQTPPAPPTPSSVMQHSSPPHVTTTYSSPAPPQSVQSLVAHSPVTPTNGVSVALHHAVATSPPSVSVPIPMSSASPTHTSPHHHPHHVVTTQHLSTSTALSFASLLSTTSPTTAAAAAAAAATLVVSPSTVSSTSSSATSPVHVITQPSHATHHYLDGENNDSF